MCANVAIDLHLHRQLMFIYFEIGFPKEDLLRHLQDGFGGDHEERSSEEHGGLKRGGQLVQFRDAARCRGLCHREAVHAVAAIFTKQGLESQYRTSTML